MFKKRLKGLLAMLLAGSMTLTMLPITASATISNSNVRVYDGGTAKQVNYLSLKEDDSVSPYLNSNNLWGVYYSYSYFDSGCTPPEEKHATGTEAFSGDALVDNFERFNNENDGINYSDFRITAKHRYIVTTDDPSVTIISAESAQTTSEFPVKIPLTNYGFSEDPLIMDYSCTPWYSITEDNGNISFLRAVKSTDEPVRFSAGDESISIGMDTFKGLYNAAIKTGTSNDASTIFKNGITILQLKPEYKTLNIPVFNGLGKQEMIDDVNPYTLSVTGGCFYSDYLDKYHNPYYVGYTKQNGEVVLSNSFMNNKKEAWEAIEGFAKDPNFDVNKLFFLRSLDVSVKKDSSEIGSFTSKDLLLAANGGKKPAAYEYIEAADENSIWRIPLKFVSGKDLLKEIETYLNEVPDIGYFSLTETTKIMVTGTEPVSCESNPDYEMEPKSYEISPLYVEDTEADPVQTVPATISDHAAVLEKAVAPEAGYIYDTSGWQLWGCGFVSGGVDGKRSIWQFKQSDLESTNGVNSIGIDQLNTLPTGSYPLIYFPQVKIAPSLEVTAPVVGKTPSTECKIIDKLGGYTVNRVEWSCGNTLLLENDEFKAGKKYTFSVVLQPDTGLQFAETTKVKINGNDATTTLNPNDGKLKVSYTFEALTKATPYIKKAPAATAITYGKALSASTLKDAVVWYSESDQKAVEGTFTWKEAATKPTVADSDHTEYDVVFTPTDAENYNTVETKITLTVNKAAPNVTALPTVADRIYHPSTVLADKDIADGTVKDVSGNSLAGKWSWKEADVVPTVDNDGYVAVFTPDDTDNYNTITKTITVNVTKATPYIKEAPTAAAITYGKTLADATLTGGSVQYSSEGDTAVDGSFAWKVDTTKPAVADSNTTAYKVVFTPTNKNYNTVEKEITVTVSKANAAPNKPDNTMEVDYGKKKVSDVTLPEGWAWQDEDKALTVGTAVKATAVYTGADKGNYKTESVEISITRAECTHATKEVKNAKDATCTEKGYTGDTYCKDCGAKLASGKEIEMTAHKWDAGKVTKEATETAEGVKTYTCSVCGKTKTEAIPKKEATTQEPPKKGDVVADDKASVTVEVTDVAKKEVEYKEPANKKAKTVSIPATVKVDGVTYKVTKVDDNAFKNNKTVTKVTVGSNIKTIGKNAFSGATKLKTVSVGKNVTEIGANAFKGCSSLTSVTLGSKATKIGANAFNGCKKLKTIKITSTKLSSKTVSKNAFKGLTKATTIKVPKKKLKAYKKLFKQKGLSSKVKVKGY